MILFVNYLLFLCLSLLNLSISEETSTKSPNIVFVLYDDLGWNDVSYNGGQLPTPNMDALFKESVMLQKHYIHLICSVSRSQFLTGRYAMYSGYGKMSPWGDGHLGGIPVGIPTLAQWLKTYNSDYTNYAVGKWMMGYSTFEQLPESKGFDHFFGAYTSAIDYSNGKISANKCGGCNPDRYDLHDDLDDYEMHEINRKLHYKNTIFDFRDKMNYYLDAEIEKNEQSNFNSPFYMFFPIQTPHGPLTTIREYSDQCEEIVGDMVGNEDARGHRLKYCEAILASDDIIGDVVSRLKKHDEIWDNTIFVLSSDNGGDVANNGCNYPLRGTKGTLFEGNQRVVTSIGGGFIPKELYGTTRESIVSSLDWTPTLLDFVGFYDQIAEEDRTWDGISQKNLILYGDDYKDREDRDHLVFNIEDRDLNSATIIFKYPEDNNKLYKYATTTKKLSIRLDGWCVPDENNDWNMIINDAELNPDLPIEAQDKDGAFVFNLDDDEAEWNNLLVNEPEDEKVIIDDVVRYAIEILDSYTANPLYSHSIAGLWEHHDEAAYALKDKLEGLDKDADIYLEPWIEFDDYMDEINRYLEQETEENNNPISDELRKLYTVSWKAPTIDVNKDTDGDSYDDISDEVSVPSSCYGLKDGEYLMKLIDDDFYPLIKVQCSNEYMIINPKNDEDWKNYFSSWQHWHYEIVGPDKNDPVNYNDWFLPSPDITEEEIACPTGEHWKNWDYDIRYYTDPEYPTQYIISPDCNVCDENDHQLYEDKTTYNMNQASYGLFFGLRRPACDFDWDSYQCNVCYHGEGQMIGTPRPWDLVMEDTAQNDRSQPNTMFGVCLTETRSAFQCTTHDWDDFSAYSMRNYKPSLGINGRFCQCAKIKKDEAEYFTVSKKEYDAKLLEMDIKEKEDAKPNPEDSMTAEDNIVKLYQSDFAMGTYRITKPGTYVIMEDIVFDFNAPPADIDWDIDSPNHPENDYWWPPSDDVEILEKYPGSGYKARDPYHLGYFAGITIETHDVVLDLNEHEIKMSKEFFYQQPFFAGIALTSQPFLPNQGPGFYGADPHFASDVVIKNGIIGRVAHHGIQGAKNKNVRIENVKIRHFMTHGMQMNGFDGLHLENVEVGPTIQECWLNHNYAHIRMLLPYIHKMANWDEYHMEKKISFDPTARSDNGREYTLNDLIDVAVEKLDKVFKYVVSDDFDKNELMRLVETDEDFKLFINTDGLPYGAITYGLYLSYQGSGIFGWDVSDKGPKNLYMKDVSVHDLYHSGNEVFGLSKNKKRFVVNTLLAPLNMEHILGGKELLKEWIQHSYNDPPDAEPYLPVYHGNIATDLYFAMEIFGNDRFDEWWLGVPYFGLSGRLVKWVQGDGPEAMSSVMGAQYWEPVCSMDGMSHPGKGLVGIKLTNAENIQIEGDLSVYNLFDYTPLGEDGVCITASNDYGSDKSVKVVSTEQGPYQTAYSMNQIFGISAELSEVIINEHANVNIRNLQSRTGRVLGLISWYKSDIKMGANSKININDIYAGIDVPKGTFEYIDNPNHEPEACSFAIYEGRNVHTNTELHETAKIHQFCVNGNIGCWGSNAFTNWQLVQNDGCTIPNADRILMNYKSFGSESYFNQQYVNIGIIITVVTMTAMLMAYYYKSNKEFKYTPIN